jgi:hypothetical protein
MFLFVSEFNPRWIDTPAVVLAFLIRILVVTDHHLVVASAPQEHPEIIRRRSSARGAAKMLPCLPCRRLTQLFFQDICPP